MSEFTPYFILLSILIYLLTFYFAFRNIKRTIQGTKIVLDADKTVDTCKTCKTELALNAQFCYYCGIQVGDRCIKCSSVMPLGARYCPNCKNRMWLAGHQSSQPS